MLKLKVGFNYRIQCKDDIKKPLVKRLVENEATTKEAVRTLGNNFSTAVSARRYYHHAHSNVDPSSLKKESATGDLRRLSPDTVPNLHIGE